MKQATIFYATRSVFKKEELSIISAATEFKHADGRMMKIGELIDFRLSQVPTDEPLEIDLEAMVRHKARSAYQRLLAPCIVEHAGIVLDAHLDAGYPGGLTQPMWDALTPEEFLTRTGSRGEGAIARAVIGYCDGMSIRTFSGETHGTIANEARGSRSFYWDVVFCPDGQGGRTYAEIAEEKDGGLAAKLLISQSAKAISSFASFLSSQTSEGLFDLG
ncbi:non-canonical purine NTP pyrophosphatase [Rhodopseudomonas sp. WA056]|uniref:non-canonical purine NTP pyrophosphatase n=1 Tax=Rhodopseudomonas sp. WA056 TaxID=2269367 RepID=UPI0013DFB68E|nr:non-canonical purine NTP pyrophosphatase [Rhodopseudomonas sp. WA056]NEW89771.1 non-canonical purine NTP pyrophosphatase [Rhodopseudomonas sp. WA056]